MYYFKRNYNIFLNTLPFMKAGQFLAVYFTHVFVLESLDLKTCVKIGLHA